MARQWRGDQGLGERKIYMASGPDEVGEGVQLVLRGSMNPAIFQPLWFAHMGILPLEEAERAQIEVVHPQITQFVVASFGLRVTPISFEVTATSRPFSELVRDLVLGTFKILEHTPLTMLGINSFCHFQAPSEEAWHGVGHMLAPKDMWRRWLLKPGMQSLTIRGAREDGRDGWIDVRVEPSSVVMPHGIFVLVNDHLQVAQGQEAESAPWLLEALDARWADSLDIASNLIAGVQELANGT